jgi:hypothetical protein
MTGARRRWLFAAVAVLALVVTWNSIRVDRQSDDARPVATGSPLAQQGVSGGDPVVPSNALGAPLPEPEVHERGKGSPIAPWWERVPPVEGDLIRIDRYAAGHVRMENDPDLGLFITFDHFTAWSTNRNLRSVRVVLSDGIVVGERRGYWSKRSDVVDVGSIPIDTSEQSLTIDWPERLPADVRSLLLVDPDNGEVLGGAQLIPVD